MAENDSVSSDLALNLDAPSNTTNASVSTAIVSTASCDIVNNVYCEKKCPSINPVSVNSSIFEILSFFEMPDITNPMIISITIAVKMLNADPSLINK